MTSVPTPEGTAAEDENILLSTLRAIATQNDCYNDDGADCSCAVCHAKWAVDKVDSWRFEAALSSRLTDGLHPREARIIRAFHNYMRSDPDGRLQQILKDKDHDVTRRDWYVATSIVQWLATNIGMSIVEEAGFKYTHYDEDRALIEAKLPPALFEATKPPDEAERLRGVMREVIAALCSCGHDDTMFVRMLLDGIKAP